LHPERRGELPETPAGDHKAVLVDIKTLRRITHSMRSAASPGDSGWTEELLDAALGDYSVAFFLSMIIRDIQNDDVSEVARDALTTCRLVALGKPGGGIRPIAIGEVLLKIACAIAVEDVSPHLQEYLKDLQYGMLTSGGCEAVHHAMEAALAADPSCSSMTIDCTNAFNCALRLSMAKTLYSLPWSSPLWGLFNLAYRNPSKLKVTIGGKEFTLWSSEGSRQGCVLGSLLFCLVIHPTLIEARIRFPEVTFKAIIDDINMWGPASRLLEAFDFLRQRLAEHGLVTNAKTTIYVPVDTQIPRSYTDPVAPLLTVNRSFIKILGGFHSRDGSVIRSLLKDHVAEHDTFFARLQMMPPLAAYKILQHCGAPRLSFLIRVHHPDLIGDVVEKFDSDVVRVLEHICDTAASSFSEESTLLFQLPASEGGANVPKLSALAPIAYAASRAAAIRTTGDAPPISFTAAKTLLDKGLAAKIDALGPIQKAHRHANKLPHASTGINFTSEFFPPHEQSAAFRWKFAVGEGDEAESNVCPGCKHTFSARCFQEHRPGCARLKNFNAATIHHAVVKAGEAVASANFIQITHEPRGYPLLASTQAARRPHEKGPDTLFLLPVSIAADWKTTVSSSSSNCCSSINALVCRKTKRAFSLYGDAVRQQGQTLTVPIILASGALLPSACALIWSLGRDNKFADFDSDCEKICRAHQRALAKVLLHHGDQSLRLRPLPVASSVSSHPGSLSVVAPHSAEALLLQHGYNPGDDAQPKQYTDAIGAEEGARYPRESDDSKQNNIISVSSSFPSFSFFLSPVDTSSLLYPQNPTDFVSSTPFSFGTFDLETTSRVEPGLLCGREEKDS